MGSRWASVDFGLAVLQVYIFSIYMKSTKLFKSGGSYAVRIPKAWVPKSGRVVLRKEANRIVITEEGADIRELAHRFAEDGLLEFERPEQPTVERVIEL